MDIRIYDPTADYHEMSLEAAHNRNEQEKTRVYEESCTLTMAASVT